MKPVELTKILKDEAYLESEKKGTSVPLSDSKGMIDLLKFGRIFMKRWLKIKILEIKFNYFAKIYENRIGSFHPKELDRLRTIRNSFVFHSYRTKKLDKMNSEYILFKNIINHRIKQNPIAL